MIAIKLLLPALALAAGVSPETLGRAVTAEIARSTTALKQEGYPAPYYLSVRVTDNHHHEARCTLGGVRYDDSHQNLIATPDVRVGSNVLDNHPVAPTERYVGRELPDLDDTRKVRHALWLKLDEEYKQAAADFLRKQALRVRRGKTDYDTDDMTKETALDRAAEPQEEDFSLAHDDAIARCRALSGGLADYPQLLGSYAEVQRDLERNWVYDSNGARVRTTGRWVRVEAGAQAMTDDGMRVQAFKAFMAPTVAGLPDEGALEAAAREMTSDLAALRAAPSTSPFNAPALLDPSVGAAVVTALAGRLAGEEQRNPDGAQTFRDKLGKPVLPDFVNLDDDPELTEFRGQPLIGHIDVDEQGVEAKKIALVEKGVLKNYLLSRYPVIGFSASNGHGRAAAGQVPMGRPTNLFLRADNAVAPAKLLELLRQEAVKRGKPYGIYIKKTRAWSQQDKTGQQQAFRLAPTLVYFVDAKTGAQTLVRDLDMVGTPLDVLGRLLAVGDDPAVTNALVDQPSGSLPVSTICPTLLLGEVELQRAETKPERPLVLPPPREND
ncbi:MAG: hypothetical protein HY925_06835 [Elusimicrobia bacterium]|nr:hypothetical protein [Elusimicrobiota bacterium]